MLKRINVILTILLNFLILTTNFSLFAAGQMLFSNRGSTVVLPAATNSKVRIAKKAKVFGWHQESIVKATGGTSFIPTADATIYDSSSPTDLPTDLVFSNSNAIAAQDRRIITNSNAITILDMKARTDSNALVSYEATNNLAVRTNSNALVSYEATNDAAVRVNSNAITLLNYKEKNDSNSIAYLNSINGSDSNSIAWLNLRVRNDSNAFMYNRRQDSNSIAYLNSINGSDSNSIAWLNMRVRNDSNAMVKYTRVYPSTYTVAADETIENFIYFRDGLTINDGKSLTIASPIPVDLLTFGSGAGAAPTLTLNESLYLKSAQFNASQPSAKIFGGGNTLFMEGDLNIGVDTIKTLTIGSNLVIDGQGHMLKFVDNSQLFVDSMVSVTLQNMKLRIGGINNVNCNHNGNLTLNNVVVNLDNDYTFTAGKLHIQDFVSVRNNNDKTMGFVPDTANGMYIYPHSVLNFDLSTTFSYNGGSVSPRGKLWMADATSWINMNGSTLKTGANGLSLTKGSLILDNKVTLQNGESPYNTTIGKAITLGDGAAAANDVNVYLLSGARTEVFGYLDYNPA